MLLKIKLEEIDKNAMPKKRSPFIHRKTGMVHYYFKQYRLQDNQNNQY